MPSIGWSGKMKKNLKDLINSFLSEPRKSSGGYAPVTEADMHDLHNIIGQLINEKWEDDPDGDSPIDYKLIDRTKYEPDHFYTLPYVNGPNSDLENYLDLALTNMKIAIEKADIAMKFKRWDKKEK
jgi:hypothetical protein